jgi:hypothetical protein
MYSRFQTVSETALNLPEYWHETPEFGFVPLCRYISVILFDRFIRCANAEGSSISVSASVSSTLRLSILGYCTLDLERPLKVVINYKR